MMTQFIRALSISLMVVSTLFGQTKTTPSAQSTEIAAIDRYAAELDRFVKRNAKSAHIYADVANESDQKENWRRFKTEKQRDKADTGENLNQNAYVWMRAGKVVATNFTFQSSSRDWAQFVMYYFRDDGTLAKTHSQLNTFFGDVSIVRDRYYSKEGTLLKTKRRILDLKTQKPKKAKEFQDVEEPIFKKVSELPFAKLL